jgi:putative PIN family toxin of toxin-antitoxin system
VRVVLDTNVLVSAILFGGVPNECLRRGLAGEFDLVSGAGLLDELERILRERFDLPPEAVAFARGDLELAAELIDPSRIEPVSRDTTDDLVLAVAKEGRADHIVTGDQDLLALGRYEGTSILTPRQFVRLLGSRSAE